MTQSQQPSSELFVRVHAYLTAIESGHASLEDREAFETLICENQDACDLYIRYMMATVDLRTWASQEEAADEEGLRFRVQGAEEVASGQWPGKVASGQWSVASEEGSGVRGQGSDAANQKSEIINHKSLAPSPQPLVSNSNPENPKSQIPNLPSLAPNLPSPVSIILDDSSSPSPLSSLPFYISHPFVFSNLFALLIIGLGALGAWFYQIDIPHQVAQTDRQSVPSRNISESEKFEIVGRVTGMVDVKWADINTSTERNNNVPLGRKYALSSGLMEITYDTGAKVILQGPCTYKVDSRDGGYLSIGKLTARLEKKGARVRGQGSEKVASGQQLVASGQWSVASESNQKSRNPEIPKSPISNPNSQISNPSSPAPAFAVRTPTAVVTDLGTEFGVEVNTNGTTTSHVFRGTIEVRLIDANAQGKRSVRLSQNESARVEVGRKQTATIRRIALQAKQCFVRELPDGQPVVLLHDTFDTRLNSASYGEAGYFGLNQELSHRQTGIYQQVAYRSGGDFSDLNNGSHFDDTQVNHMLSPGKLCLCTDYGRAGWAVLGRRFPRDIAVSADLTPVAIHWPDKSQPETFYRNAKSPNWIALGIRGRGVWFDRNMLPLATDAGAVFLVHPDGKWKYFENGRQITVGNIPPSPSYHVTMQVVGDKLRIHVNDISLKLDANRPNGVRILRDWAAVTKDNFVSLGTCNAVSLGGCNMNWAFDVKGRDLSTVDNLTISTVGSKDERSNKSETSSEK